MEPESPLYNIPSAFRIHGGLDVESLRKAIAAVGSRHETLRTVFPETDGEPSQVITDTGSTELVELDLSNRLETEKLLEAHRFLSKEAERPFDLSKDLPCRFTLLKIEPKDHILLIIEHHIASDGWSRGILWGEISKLYKSFCTGETAALPDLPIQYADFAVWQRQWLQGPTLEKQLNYWKQQLSGSSPFLQLPADRPRPPVQSYRGSTESFLLPLGLLHSLQTLSRQENSTLFMTLLAAFNILLYRYTGQQDIVVGSPIAGRNRLEIENLIGFFVNTLALRSDLSANPSFRHLLTRVRETCLQAYAHQDLPFEKLVEELQPERNLSYSPFFQVMFVLQNAPMQPLELSGLQITPIEIHTGTSKFDLTFSLTTTVDGLHGTIEYSTDLFDASTIQRLAGHFQTLLQGIVDDPDQPIARLPLLTDSERHRILVEWNNTKTDYPGDQCVHQLFEAQVEKTPNANAVVFEDQSLTYGELNKRANQLAHYLRNHGVGPEVLVGICMERSLEMIVGLLGILKAGGAYVPLDPYYPKERLAFMLEDTDAPILLTQSSLLKSLPDHKAKVICLDSDWPDIAQSTRSNPDNRTNPDNLIYAIYTSGSTGIPKGVIIPHRGVVRLLFGVDYARLSGSQSFLQLSSLSFDAATFEIWGALLHGATCVLFPGRVPTADQLEDSVHQHHVDTLWLTASLFNAVVDEKPQALKNIRQLLTGGEALSPHHVSRALKYLPDTQIINGYGPTEATTFTCCYPIPRQIGSNQRSIPIGHPIPNTSVYVLDPYMQPAPIGIPGELHIGGDGLARGYLHRPELTAEKFIPNPFSPDPKERLYKSGDLVKWLPDGNLDFLSRMDNQVKIRGYRIELGEIESVLSQHAQVKKAVVAVGKDSPGDKRLVAYVVPSQEDSLSPNTLRAFLKEKLPDYMVPSFFILIDDFPLTSSSKVDRLALLVPGFKDRQLDKATFAAPRNPIEEKLATIWQEVLGLDSIGIRDNFFEKGGHSILAVRLFAQIEKVFGKRLPLAILFQEGTIERLANLIKDNGAIRHGGTVIEIQAGNIEKPLFVVHGLSGELLSWEPLLRHLKTDMSIYGLQSPDQGGLEKPFSDLKLMVREYVDCMCSMHFSGPCSVLGYSYGGKVALEIAQQLRARGRDVGLLGIIDTGPGSVKLTPIDRLIRLPFYFAKNLPFWIYEDLIRADSKSLQGRILRKLRTLKKRFRHFFTAGPGVSYELDLEDIFEQSYFENINDRSLSEIHFEAWKKYTASPYPGRVTLFRSSAHPLFHSLIPDLGWSQIALGGLDIKIIPGNHLSIIREPNIRYLAKVLQDSLESR